MPEMMTLIGGRTSKQGTALCASKLGPEYAEISSTLEMNVEDMARLGLKNGSKVRLRTPEGEAVLKCKGRETKDLPKGLKNATPQDLAQQALKAAGDTTSVTVDGTARVAGRDAYQLLIKPKQSASTIGSTMATVWSCCHPSPAARSASFPERAPSWATAMAAIFLRRVPLGATV